MKKYSLVGVDGNAFSVMGYVKNALVKTGHGDMVHDMFERCMSGDYNNLLRVAIEYIGVANKEG